MRSLIGALLGIGLATWGNAADIRVEHGVYGVAGGHKLRMTLCLPEGGAKPYPAVVLIHGGGWTFGNRFMKVWYAKQLARQGYVAMSINYRMLPVHTIVDCVHDSKAAVRYLRLNAEKYGIDPDRIGVMGDSAGGHLALMLAATQPEDGLEGSTNPGASSAVQAAVSIYGVADFSLFEKPGKRKPAKVWRKMAGEEQLEGRDAFEALSPIRYVHPGMCPVLLLHGTKDPLVAYTQSEQFYKSACANGVPARLVSFPGWGHAFDYFRPHNRAKVFEEALGFFNTHLAEANSVQTQEQ